jgi:hypothetical protein
MQRVQALTGTVKRESPDFIMDKWKKIVVWGFSKTRDLARFSHGPSYRGGGKLRAYKAREGKMGEGVLPQYVKVIFLAQRSKHGAIHRHRRLPVKNAG